MHRTEQDFAAFERILIEARQREPLPILSYCVMDHPFKQPWIGGNPELGDFACSLIWNR